jgi:hypothetical protein
MKKVFGKALCFLLLGMIYMPAVYSQETDISNLPDLIPFRKGKKWGFCDRNKKIIIPVKYDTVSFFSNGFSYQGASSDTLALVKQRGKEFWINTSGKEIAYTAKERDGERLEETRIGYYERSVFMDPATGKKGFIIVSSNDTVLPARYEDVDYESSPNYYVTVKENGKWGVIKAKTQQWLILPAYDKISRHFETADDTSEIYIVQKGSVRGLFINDTLLLPVKYTDIVVRNWYDWKLIITKDEKGAAMLDLAGKSLTNVPYEHLEIISGDLIHAKRNGKWGLVTKKGKEVVSCKYEDVSRYDNRNMYLVKYKGRGGWIDKKGTEYFED